MSPVPPPPAPRRAPPARARRAQRGGRPLQRRPRSADGHHTHRARQLLRAYQPVRGARSRRAEGGCAARPARRLTGEPRVPAARGDPQGTGQRQPPHRDHSNLPRTAHKALEPVRALASSPVPSLGESLARCCLTRLSAVPLWQALPQQSAAWLAADRAGPPDGAPIHVRARAPPARSARAAWPVPHLPTALAPRRALSRVQALREQQPRLHHPHRVHGADRHQRYVRAAPGERVATARHLRCGVPGERATAARQLRCGAPWR